MLPRIMSEDDPERSRTRVVRLVERGTCRGIFGIEYPCCRSRTVTRPVVENGAADGEERVVPTQQVVYESYSKNRLSEYNARPANGGGIAMAQFEYFTGRDGLVHSRFRATGNNAVQVRGC